MGILIDIIVIAIIALSVYLGYRKGLIALAIKLFAVIIALVATLILYRPISTLIINNTSLDETIQNAIIEKAEGTNDENKENNTEVNNAENNTQNNTEIIEKEVQNNLVEQAKAEMLPETARSIAINIINIAVILILYFAIKIALHFVTAIANIIAKIPIIKQFNKLGGIIYGLLRGILLIYVILLIISFVGQINPENQVHKSINESNITKAMYQNNILNILIK